MSSPAISTPTHGSTILGLPASNLPASAVASSGPLNDLSVDQRRARQTPLTPSPFKLALEGGSRVLLAGAAAATRLVGLPTLSAAITRVGGDAASTPLELDTNASPLAGGALSSAGASSRVTDDLQLLALQDQIQREGRQIALVSNVMKARHETTKAAIGNIRS